jgi:hypothetical protein
MLFLYSIYVDGGHEGTAADIGVGTSGGARRIYDARPDIGSSFTRPGSCRRP